MKHRNCSFVFGPGFDSVEEDRQLRLFAVDSYVSLLQGETAKLPQCFLQVISWVSTIRTITVEAHYGPSYPHSRG